MARTQGRSLATANEELNPAQAEQRAVEHGKSLAGKANMTGGGQRSERASNAYVEPWTYLLGGGESLRVISS